MWRVTASYPAEGVPPLSIDGQLDVLELPPRLAHFAGAAFSAVESCELLDDWFGSNAICRHPQDMEEGSGLSPNRRGAMNP